VAILAQKPRLPSIVTLQRQQLIQGRDRFAGSSGGGVGGR